MIAVDVTPLPQTIPPDAAAAERERMLKRHARIAPEAALADYLLNANLKYEASPLQSYFDYARATGESSARRQLPDLMARLQQAGLAPKASGPRPRP